MPPAAAASTGRRGTERARAASDTAGPDAADIVVAPVAAARGRLAPLRLQPPAPASDVATDSCSAAPAAPALKDALLAEIRRSKNTLYSLAVAQAQRIDVADERITFTFRARIRTSRACSSSRTSEWLEGGGAAARRTTRFRSRRAQLQAAGAAAGVQRGDGCAASHRRRSAISKAEARCLTRDAGHARCVPGRDPGRRGDVESR